MFSKSVWFVVAQFVAACVSPNIFPVPRSEVFADHNGSQNAFLSPKQPRGHAEQSFEDHYVIKPVG